MVSVVVLPFRNESPRGLVLEVQISPIMLWECARFNLHLNGYDHIAEP